MKHIHFDIKGDGILRRILGMCKDGSDCAVMPCSGDDPEGLYGALCGEAAASPRRERIDHVAREKDYGHHNYPLERIEKTIAWLKSHGNEKIGIAGASRRARSP